MWEENPVFGIGPGNLIYTWPIARQAHNLAAQLLSDLGLFGTVPFVLLFCLCYYRSNWLSKIGRRLSEQYSQQPDLGREASVMDFISKAGAAAKQLLVILFVAGLTGHNMLRYNWVHVIYLTVAGTWITHKYINMGLVEKEPNKAQSV
jgi:O-antigen ligase